MTKKKIKISEDVFNDPVIEDDGSDESLLKKAIEYNKKTDHYLDDIYNDWDENGVERLIHRNRDGMRYE